MKRIFHYALLITALMWTSGIYDASDVLLDSPPAAYAAKEVVDAEHTGESPEQVHEEDRSLLSIQQNAYFWQVLLFLILFGVLAKFVWPPILKGLRDRESKMRDDLQRAEDAANEATATLEQYKQQLAEAQKKAQEVIDQSRSEAQKVAAQVKADAEAEIQQVRQRANNEITAAKEQALSDLYAQTATLATQVAGQILHREINPEDQQTLVQESLSKLTDTSRN